MQRGLIALDGEGIAPISTQETGRGVDVQFVVPEEDREKSVKALHKELVSASGGSDSALDMVA
jgi:aspartate kinase